MLEPCHFGSGTTGRCLLCDHFASLKGHYHCSGEMWQVVENQFCKLPELLLFSIVFLALLDCAGACAAGEAGLLSCGPTHLLITAAGCCFVENLAATSTQFCHYGEGAREMPLPGGKLLLSLLDLRPVV